MYIYIMMRALYLARESERSIDTERGVVIISTYIYVLIMMAVPVSWLLSQKVG